MMKRVMRWHDLGSEREARRSHIANLAKTPDKVRRDSRRDAHLLHYVSHY